jgi:dienelactone hydrolase
MSDHERVILFHSALGLRPAVLDWAERLRAEGHDVETPDLYDGAVFDDLDEGVAKADSMGMEEAMRRAQEAVTGSEPGYVLAGFSFGAAAAQGVAQNREGGRAVILMHGALKAEDVGPPWPARVPVQVHYAVDDPWVEADAADSLAESVRAAGGHAEVYVYPGSGHLFADPGQPDYDPELADQTYARVVEFLAAL